MNLRIFKKQIKNRQIELHFKSKDFEMDSSTPCKSENEEYIKITKY